MTEEKYQVHLDNFDGPLDLLLHLIDKNKLDIYDIPISSITSQYMAFLAEAQEMDLEIASEFLVIAATLINIKAKMLLPKKKNIDVEEADPREELVNKLLEYKFFKEAALVLEDNAKQSRDYFTKEIDVQFLAKDFTPTNPVANISLNELLAAFQKVILHIKEEPPILEVSKEEFYIETFMDEIVSLLVAEKGVKFSNLFSKGDSKRKIVTIFLAVLELLKLSRISIVQKENFGELWIFSINKDEV